MPGSCYLPDVAKASIVERRAGAVSLDGPPAKSGQGRKATHLTALTVAPTNAVSRGEIKTRQKTIDGLAVAAWNWNDVLDVIQLDIYKCNSDTINSVPLSKLLVRRIYAPRTHPLGALLRSTPHVLHTLAGGAELGVCENQKQTAQLNKISE